MEIYFFKFNNSVVMCKGSSNFPVVETYFNYDHYPGIVDATNRSIGLSEQSIRVKEHSLDCLVTRKISLPSYSDKFFDLKNEYYLLVAKGPLNGNI